MDFYGHIQDGKLTLPDHVKAVRKQYIASMKDGAAVKESIAPVRKPRTSQQLKAFFGMIISAAKRCFDEQGFDVMGVPLADDQIREVLYHYCGHVGEDGVPKRLSSPMSTIEAAQFFENCRNWLAGFGVVIPDPDPKWREPQAGKSAE